MLKHWRIIVIALVVVSLPAIYVIKRQADMAALIRADKEAQEILKQAKTLIEPGQGSPMLLDLGSDTCVPCQQMKPILEDLGKEYQGRVTVQIVDVYEHQDWAEKYGVYLIPLQIFFSPDGKELFRHEGFFSKDEILAKFEEFGWTS